jgi:hypothetical protein
MAMMGEMVAMAMAKWWFVVGGRRDNGVCGR